MNEYKNLADFMQSLSKSNKEEEPHIASTFQVSEVEEGEKVQASTDIEKDQGPSEPMFINPTQFVGRLTTKPSTNSSLLNPRPRPPSVRTTLTSHAQPAMMTLADTLKLFSTGNFSLPQDSKTNSDFALPFAPSSRPGSESALPPFPTRPAPPVQTDRLSVTTSQTGQKRSKSRGMHNPLQPIDFSGTQRTETQVSAAPRAPLPILRPHDGLSRSQKVAAITAKEKELKVLRARAAELKSVAEERARVTQTGEAELDRELRALSAANWELVDQVGRLRCRFEDRSSEFDRKVYDNKLRFEESSRKSIEAFEQELLYKYRNDDEETVNYLTFKLRLLREVLAKRPERT